MERLQKEYESLYTIGSSDNSIEEFIGLLHEYGVEVVGDVRRFPKSRFSWFEKEALRKRLEEEGIEYRWWGEGLGGYRHGGYRTYMLSPKFKEAIKEVEKTAKERKLCLMCSERLPWRCHRRFIAEALMGDGWEILHILGRGRVWRPKQDKGI
jgi:uncharacterized protein (DUF488 family)